VADPSESPEPAEDSGAKRRRFSRTEIVLFGLIFALSVGEGGARFLSPVYLKDQGAAVGSIGLALSGFGTAALAARFLIGSTFRATTVRLTIAISAAASTASLFLITTTSSTAVFSTLIAIHGMGWGVMATVLLTLIMAGKEKGSAAAIIGFYVGVEGLGRTGSPILAGILGGAFGPSTGMRIHTVLFAVTALVGVALLRDARAEPVVGERPRPQRRIDLSRFRHVPLAAWVAALTGFYLNTTNAVLNTFFPLLGLTLGFSLAQIGSLAGARSAVSALIRFVAHKAFDVIPFRVQFAPLYLLNAISASLIGAIAIYPAISTCLLVFAAQIAFVRVGRRRGFSFIVAGTLTVLIELAAVVIRSAGRRPVAVTLRGTA